MGRITVLKGTNLTLTTGVRNFFAIRTAAAGAAAARVAVKRFEVWQRGTTTLQQLEGELAVRDSAGTFTATALAPVNVRPINGPASGLAGNTAPVGADARSGINASVDSGGAYTQVLPFGFGNTIGYIFKPDPEEQILVPASTVLTGRLLLDPSTLTGWGFELVLDEE